MIFGQGNFSVKTVDDLYTILIQTVPNIKCAIAMNESKPQLTRVNGNDDELKKLAAETAREARPYSLRQGQGRRSRQSTGCMTLFFSKNGKPG